MQLDPAATGADTVVAIARYALIWAVGATIIAGATVGRAALAAAGPASFGQPVQDGIQRPVPAWRERRDPSTPAPDCRLPPLPESAVRVPNGRRAPPRGG